MYEPETLHIGKKHTYIEDNKKRSIVVGKTYTFIELDYNTKTRAVLKKIILGHGTSNLGDVVVISDEQGQEKEIPFSLVKIPDAQKEKRSKYVFVPSNAKGIKSTKKKKRKKTKHKNKRKKGKRKTKKRRKKRRH